VIGKLCEAGYKPEHVSPAVASKVKMLPEGLRRSLTWDQGPEMRNWKQVRVDAGIEVCFCDPHPPGSAAPTRTPTGCCASTSPKGTDFAAVTEAQLNPVADELNDRPRKQLGFAKPPSNGCKTARLRRFASPT